MAEGINGLFTKENAVFSVNHVIEGAAVAISDDRTTTGESLNGSDAEWLKRGENVTFGLFEVFFKAGLVLEGNELDVAGFFSKTDEFFMLGAFTNDSEREL